MNATLEEELNFSVEKLTTTSTRYDLIVKDKTSVALQTMEIWLKARKNDRRFLSTFASSFSGFHAVFTGPAGTGKTFAASLLGKEHGYDVYRIDLNKVFSKYIIETEQNLDKIFTRAEAMDVILFFDEADALFGKRTDVAESYDRYASAEVSHLLQRIDSFKGIIILAFNKPLNINSPFFTRFNLVVEFERPDSGQRLKLWRKYLPMPIQQEMKFEVDEIAQKYKLTGGEIINVIKAARENNAAGFSKALMLKELLTKPR